MCVKFISWINGNFDQKESGDKKEQKESMNIHGGIEMGGGLSVKLLSLKGNIPAFEECAASAAAPRACAGPVCQMCVSSLSGRDGFMFHLSH